MIDLQKNTTITREQNKLDWSKPLLQQAPTPYPHIIEGKILRSAEFTRVGNSYGIATAS
ncbi:hypothetical protein LA02_925 [Francisella philomiragia]|nr:hypothetical protein LA02_925 [Francisella philomiragia]